MKRTRVGSSLASLFILACFCAFGVLEAHFILRSWPEAAIAIMLRQLLSGLILLGLGGQLSSPGLKGELGVKKPRGVLVGYSMMVVGTVAVVSALAGVSYVGITS